MWCAALPCARDFDARLDGTAVVLVDRPALRGTTYGIHSTYNPVVTTYPVNNINLIYSTRAVLSFLV